MSKSPDNDVALADLRHTTARKLQRVIGGLVVEDLDDNHDAFLGRDVRRDAQLARQAAGLGHRGYFVDHYAQHAVHHRSKRPSAVRSVGAFARAAMKHAGEGGDLREAERIGCRPLARGLPVHTARCAHERIWRLDAFHENAAGA